jgi:hypothetical protein
MKTKVDKVKMFNAKVALAEITYRVFDTYNTNKGWVVKKMRSKYANIIAAIWPIIYQKDKVQYFNNMSVMMIDSLLIGLPLCIFNWSKF